MTDAERAGYRQALADVIARALFHEGGFPLLNDQGYTISKTDVDELRAALDAASERLEPIEQSAADRSGPIRCEGRYPVPATRPPREEPFEVTYRCGRLAGHEGPHGIDDAAPTQPDGDKPQDIGPDPQCKRCNGSGLESNRQFHCPCRWSHHRAGLTEWGKDMGYPRDAAPAAPEEQPMNVCRPVKVDPRVYDRSAAEILKDPPKFPSLASPGERGEAPRAVAVIQRLLAERDAWKDAIIDAAVVDWVYVKEHDTNPRKAVNDLLAWSQKIALDPAVSKQAAEWRDEIARLRTALRDLIDAIPEKTLTADPPLRAWVQIAESVLTPPAAGGTTTP